MSRISKAYSWILLFMSVVFLASCGLFGGSKEVSRTTGWEYNDPLWGGYEVAEARQQVTGPGLVFIEGGTFVIGATQQNLLFDWDNIPRRVTVQSFYMDETEVANVDYNEYMYWLSRVFGTDYPEVIRKALPDTLVWRDKLSYNEPYVDLYFRHPGSNKADWHKIVSTMDPMRLKHFPLQIK